MPVVLLGQVVLVYGEHSVAVPGEKHRGALQMAADSSDARYVVTPFVGVAGCVPDAATAATLLGAAESFRRSPVPGAGAERTYAERVEERTRSVIGRRTFEEAVAAGRLLATAEAIALGLTDDRTSPGSTIRAEPHP